MSQYDEPGGSEEQIDYRGCAVADYVVGHCRHITVDHPHDWACAVCIAARVDAAVAGAIAEERREKQALLSEMDRLKRELRQAEGEAVRRSIPGYVD